MSNEEEQAISPIPNHEIEAEPELLTFYDALKAVELGATISKEEWPDNVSAYLKNDELRIHLKDGEHTWTISQADMEGEDYYIIN